MTVAASRKGALALRFRHLCLVLGLLLGGIGPVLAAGTAASISIFGPPKYPAAFEHFDYVNPDAPKGGELRLYQLGGFDNVNPLAAKGLLPAARGLGPQPIDLIRLTFDSLLVRPADDPDSGYGLIAESVETAPDGRWIVFNLRPQARFHNGSAITADDILFSFDKAKIAGHPLLQGVVRAEKLADRKVRFVFAAGADRTLPLVVGDLPIFSKAAWQGRDAAAPDLQAPIGSGPYAVGHGGSRTPHRPDPSGRLLGQGSAGGQRSVQFRAYPYRLLSRCRSRLRRLQGRGLRRPL